MNWIAGILALVFFWVPMMYILYRFHRDAVEIDRKYQERLKEIEKRYGVKL